MMGHRVRTRSLAEVVGSRVRLFRERMGWDQLELAHRVGIEVEALSAIESGRFEPRLHTLVALAEALGLPLEVFLYADDDPLEAHLKPIETPENLPALQFWLQRCRYYLDVEAMVGKRGISAPVYVLPSSLSSEEERERIEAIADEERQRLMLGIEPIYDLVSVVEESGLRVIGADLPEDDVDGAFLFVPEYDSAVALINRTKPPLRQRFTLAHEYGHLLLHRDRADIRDRDLFSASASEECQANAFAAAFLMPKALIDRMYDEYGFSRSCEPLPMYGWLVMARRLWVSPQALALRLYNLGYIQESERDWVLGEGAPLLREMELAFYDEPLRVPKVPTLSERLRSLVLHAYCQGLMTASAASKVLGLSLSALQDYFTASKMDALGAKQFFERVGAIG